MFSVTPRPHFTPGKDLVPIVQEAGWSPGPVWTGGKFRRQRDSMPYRPPGSSVAIPTELPGPHQIVATAANPRHEGSTAVRYTAHIGR